MPKEMTSSVLTFEQWKAFDELIFSDADAALIAVRDWARYKCLSPIGSVILAAQYALTALPPGTAFDAGLGKNTTNLFVAIVGRPGQGKDRHAAAISITDGVRVTNGHADQMQLRTFEPQSMPLGSGEGITRVLAPDKDTNLSTSTLFHCSEIGGLEAHMKREGSSTRATLLSAYSGGPLGAVTKAETMSVKAGSYSCGVWVGVQPDRAGVLLDGADDGMRHRWVWTELLDPTRPRGRRKSEAKPLDVIVPPDLLEKPVFTFPKAVEDMVWEHAENAVMWGVELGNKGHAMQTRLKLACGLALLSGRAKVSDKDWGKSGVLMDYSEAVQQGCERHLSARNALDIANKETEKDKAEEELYMQRSKRQHNNILQSVEQASGNTVGKSDVRKKLSSKQREVFDDVLTHLTAAKVVAIQTVKSGEYNKEVIKPGPNWNKRHEV